jgi:Protein of unknown function (DUF4058)
MPLLDHFHGRLSKHRHWQSFHATWAGALRDQLNGGLLPQRYFAEVQTSHGSRVEIDVPTFEDASEPATSTNGGVAVWAPPRPTHRATLQFTHPDLFEVRVFSDVGGPQLVAAVELVSPSNKDRPAQRHQFAIKCASYLQDNIGLVVVDMVTEHRGNLHRPLLEILQVAQDRAKLSDEDLYAGAYRAVTVRKTVKLEYWIEPLAVGGALPTMPLWIAPDLCLPLNLEQAYVQACKSSRIKMG